MRLNAELSDDSQPERRQELVRGVETVLHEMDDGRHRELVERIVRAQLETATRVGAEYDLLVWESDIVSSHLLEEALSKLTRSDRVYIPTLGEYAGALVIELEPSAKAKQTEDESQAPLLRVLVRSNGLPTYTGKDIPYMMWKLGCFWLRCGCARSRRLSRCRC